MWEEIVLGVIRILTWAILAVTGIISIFLYRQTKKRGFMLIGTSFILEAIYGIVPDQAVANILIYTFGMNDRETFGTLLLITFTVQLIFAVLFLGGLILLRREFKSKPAQ